MTSPIAQRNIEAILNQKSDSSKQGTVGQRQTDGAISTFNQNFDVFLKLLTSSLKHQDPSNPMDTSELTNQYSAFAQVEQQIYFNRNLETLINYNKDYGKYSAVSYMGKKIEVKGNKVIYDGTEPVTMTYDLDKAAKSAILEVYDKDGKKVASYSVPGSEGRHDFKWQGLDKSGIKKPAGDYSFKVFAVNDDGKPVNANHFVLRSVDGVKYDGDTIFLQTQNDKWPIRDITNVKN